MVDLTKRRVSPDAAKNGQWFEDPDGFKGLAVKITALDTDPCVRVRQGILEEMFGAADVEIDKYPGLADYLNVRVLLDAAVKDIRGLTSDSGKAIPYTRDYLAGILLKDQVVEPGGKKTPDGKVYDEGAALIYKMLIGRGFAASKILAGEEKKEPPASFAGGGASPSANATGGTTEGEATQSGSAKGKLKN